jgi:hypothetical protein
MSHTLPPPCPFFPIPSESHASKLALGITRTRVLTELDLSMNDTLGDAGLEIIKFSLLENDSITRLSLKACNLTDGGASDLATALGAGGNRSITSVNLDDNGVGSAGAQALAHCLSANACLTDLSLRWNAIDGLGACCHGACGQRRRLAARHAKCTARGAVSSPSRCRDCCCGFRCEMALLGCICCWLLLVQVAASWPRLCRRT